MKKIPQRTCIGCRQKKDKTDLIRVVKDKENNISIDKSGKKSGRGAYLCDDINCLNSAIKSKRLEKEFKMKLQDDVYENLRGVIVEE